MLPNDYTQQLKDAYPKRYGGQGWAALRRLIPARIQEGFTWDEILDGTKAYAKFCTHTGKIGTELVKQAKTFYGRDAWFAEDYDVPEMKRRDFPTDVVDREAEDRKWREDMQRLENMKPPLKVVK